MPHTGTLRLPPHRHPVPTRTRLRTRRVPLVAYVLVLLLVPVAVLGGARMSGWWVTTGHTLPSTALGGGALGVDAPGSPARGGPDPGAASGASDQNGGPTAAPANPADVKGSMTVQQVLDAFPQTGTAEIYDLFGVPADTPASTQLKTLAKNGNGYEVSDFREWLAKRVAASG